MRTALIWRAGLHLSLRMSRQILPVCLGLELTDLINVGMVDLGSEEHLWRDHGVLVWEEELGSEHASLVRSSVRASNLHMEMSEVDLIRLSVDSDN